MKKFSMKNFIFCTVFVALEQNTKFYKIRFFTAKYKMLKIVTLKKRMTVLVQLSISVFRCKKTDGCLGTTVTFRILL